MSTEKNAQLPHGEAVVFRRKTHKRLVRYFYLLMLTGLIVSLPMSMVERHQHNLPIDLRAEAFLLVFILLMNILILPSSLFEVHAVIIKEDGLALETMFAPVDILYSDIISFKMPSYLVWAFLRTKRGFYLINKRDIGNFDQLLSFLAPRLPDSVKQG
jgi:hypothetical protein